MFTPKRHPQVLYYTACAWCQTKNPLDIHLPMYCRRCHHRLAKPKAECDCLTCASPRQADFFQTLDLPIKGREH